MRCGAAGGGAARVGIGDVCVGGGETVAVKGLIDAFILNNFCEVAFVESATASSIA